MGSTCSIIRNNYVYVSYSSLCKENKFINTLINELSEDKNYYIIENSYAIYNLNKIETVRLLIYMKKYFQLRGMNLIAQVITAKVKGRFKDNSIKNSKFIEKSRFANMYNRLVMYDANEYHKANNFHCGKYP